MKKKVKYQMAGSIPSNSIIHPSVGQNPYLWGNPSITGKTPQQGFSLPPQPDPNIELTPDEMAKGAAMYQKGFTQKTGGEKVQSTASKPVDQPMYNLENKAQWGQPNYNHIKLSNEIKGIAAFFRTNHANRADNFYNRAQFIPTEGYLPHTGNTSEQAQFGMGYYEDGGEVDEFHNGGLTATKAMEMLKDGTAHGKKLTKKQKAYFAQVAHGGKHRHYHPEHQLGGPINNTGYTDGTETAQNSSNTIPGGDITMENTSQRLIGTPIKNGIPGNSIMMQPGKNYKFNKADFVHEMPADPNFSARFNMEDGRPGVDLNYKNLGLQMQPGYTGVSYKKNFQPGGPFNPNGIISTNSFLGNMMNYAQVGSMTSDTKLNPTQQRYMAEQIRKGKKPFVVDKGVKKEFYGKVDPKTHKVSVKSFEVLTGKGDKNQLFSPYSVDELDKQDARGNHRGQVTPVGEWQTENTGEDLYGGKYLNLRSAEGADIGLGNHNTADRKERDRFYGNKNLNDNAASWGCINGQCGDINSVVNQMAGNPLQVIDSRMSLSENQRYSKMNQVLADNHPMATQLHENPNAYFDPATNTVKIRPQASRTQPSAVVTRTPRATTNTGGNSIVDYINSQKGDASFSAREKMAADAGIENYKGTAEQNIKLMGLLKGSSKQFQQSANFVAAAAAKKAAGVRELARRKKVIAASKANPGFATSKATEDFRIYPNDPDSFVDNWLNPGTTIIGPAADELGHTLGNPDASVGDYVKAIGNPLLFGAVAGAGAKTTGQFFEEIANPAKGLFEGNVAKNITHKAGEKIGHRLAEDLQHSAPHAEFQSGGEVDLDQEIKNDIFTPAAEVVKEEAPVEENTPEEPTNQGMEAGMQEYFFGNNSKYRDGLARTRSDDAESTNSGAGASVPELTGEPTIEAFKSGIANVESGGDYYAKGKGSTAFGKYQFLKGTREGVRKQFFPQISSTDFEKQYTTDPKFQERVMDVYSSHLINKFHSPIVAAHAFFLGEGAMNKANDPNYNPGGHNVSAGVYDRKFTQGYNKKYEQGGEYNVTDEELEELKKQGYTFKIK